MTWQHLSWYTFNGWSPKRLENVTWDQTYTATWSANTNTSYTVEIYEQQADGTWLQTPTSTIERTWTTDTTAEVTTLDITKVWYALDGSKANILNGNIEWNGSLVLKVYLKKQFTVTYKPWAHGTFSNDVHSDLDYGTLTPTFAWDIDSHEDGYVFSGWDTELPTTVRSNATYTAIWWEDKNHDGQNDEFETKYTVTFVAWGNGELEWKLVYDNILSWYTLNTVESFQEPTTIPNVNYIFKKWSPELNKDEKITGNLIYTGLFAPDFNANNIDDRTEAYFSVTYTDWVYWEEIFGDQITINILTGLSTPAFIGIPTRTNYIFAWWYPSVTAKVTKNQTYTATWYEDFNHDGQNDAEETKIKVTFLSWAHWSLNWAINWKIEYQVLSGLTLWWVDWYEEPTVIPDVDYMFSWWNKVIDTTSPLTEDVSYTAIYWEDKNYNNQNDENEEKYTVNITYVYSRGWTAAETYSLTNQLSWFTYNVDSPDIDNYHADKLNLNWIITDNVNEVVTYAPDVDENHNDIADQEETKYTVTYTDWVDWETIFANQTTSNILSWTVTPVFSGTPTRLNYVFNWWTPEVAAKVTANATYTATWLEDMNNNWVADENEEKYTVNITYVYSRGWTAAETYSLTNQLSWFTYNVDSPSIDNYHADKPNLSWTITDNVNEIVTYTPNNDTNHNGYADEWEDKYTITVYYNYSRWWKAADTQSWEYLSWINYLFVSPNIEYYTPDIIEVSGTTTWTESFTVIYTPSNDKNGNGVADQEEIPFTVRFLSWDHGTLWWTTEYSVLSWLKLSDIEWYQTPTTTANTHYVFSWWSPSLNINSKVLSDETYTAIWYEDFNENGENDEFETKYTVRYTDWVDGEIVFADQTTNNILSWTNTPLFSGTPSRINYVFNWWTPSIAEKVTDNAVYTATWKVDTNNNWVADEEETYTLRINYVYSKWGDAATSHVVSVLSWAEYNVSSPSVTNYQTTDTIVSWIMPGEDKTITVIYTPITDENHNDIADQEEPKYTLTIQYHDAKWGVVYNDYSHQYVAWASYEKESQTKEYYTITSWATVSWIMPANNITVTVIYTANLDVNDNGIADQNETHYTLTIHYVNAKGWMLYPDYSGSYVVWAEYNIASNTSNTHYTIESWKETISWTMPAENTVITVIYTAKTDVNGNGIADEEEAHHTLTIHYVNSKWVTLFADYTENIVKWATYIVNSPAKVHYISSIPIVSGIIGDEDVEVTVTYNTETEDTNNNGIADEEETAHVLTIMYRYSRGGQASETVFANYLSWISYSVTSPIIANYIADKLTVSWIMWDAAKTIIVTYIPETDENHNDIADQEEAKYTATVHYVYSRGWVAHTDKIQQDMVSGLNYNITSPVISYYTPSEQTILWTITWENVEFTVIYTPNNDSNHNGYADEEEPKYTVTYTDWVDGEVVFANQITKNILSWENTPTFNWSTTRLNYIFSWWTPSIAEKVTTNATYTATWKEDMNNNGIDDVIETKYTVTFKDWEKILSTQEFVSWAVIVLPTQPTKSWYTFDGWDGLPDDWKMHWEELTLTVKWKVVIPNTNTWERTSAGGWRKIKDFNTNDTKEHNSANLSWTNLTWDQTKFEAIDWSETMSWSKGVTIKYSEEVLDAYTWAYSKDITTLAPIDVAKPDWWLYRQHMAKMIVNFAVNVLWREIPEKWPQICLWKDGPNAFESKEMEEYALKACKLWLMWIDMEYFQPELPVTRAQFGTILSRLLYGTKYAWWTPYYRKHLNALKENLIMAQIENPEERIELREWVWVMLMRFKDLGKN